MIREVRERLLLLCVSGYVGKTGCKGNFVLEILTGIMNVCWKSESGRRGSMSEMWSVFGAWGVVENYMNYFEEGKVDEKDEYA